MRRTFALAASPHMTTSWPKTLRSIASFVHDRAEDVERVVRKSRRGFGADDFLAFFRPLAAFPPLAAVLALRLRVDVRVRGITKKWGAETGRLQFCLELEVCRAGISRESPSSSPGTDRREHPAAPAVVYY